MKLIAVVPLVLGIVTIATGQGYEGRHPPQTKLNPSAQAIKPRPITDPRSSINPKPITPSKTAIKPVAKDPYQSNNFGGSPFPTTTLPPEIEALLGGSIMGGAIPGGLFSDLPPHGGSGADPNANYDANAWSDPWNGTAFPVDFRGDFSELVHDRVNNVFYRPNQQISEQQFMRVRDVNSYESVSFDPASFQRQQNNVGQFNQFPSNTAGGIRQMNGPFGIGTDNYVGNNGPSQQVQHTKKVQSTLTSKSSRIITAGRPSYLNERPLNADLSGNAGPSVMGHNIGTVAGGHIVDKTASSSFINPARHIVADLSVNAASHEVQQSTGGSLPGHPTGSYDNSQNGISNPADLMGHGNSLSNTVAMVTGHDSTGQGVYEGGPNMDIRSNHVPMQPMDSMGNLFGSIQTHRDQMGMRNDFGPMQSQPLMQIVPNPVPRRIQDYPEGYRGW
ncbi:hypothetical protein ACF0H5_013296 [Mactra antiquata]